MPNSHRSDVFGRNVVATTQPLASQAGLLMYAKGGNAIDAAIATAITLTVVEPTMNGIGSDAFCIVWDGSTLHGLSASGRYPKAWETKHFQHVTQMPHQGWESVTVPGAVSAWVDLSKKFGKLPFEMLFEPAIHYARHGFFVSPIIADQWATQIERYHSFDEFKKIFSVNGEAPNVGQRFYLADHADSLEDIALTKGESFYRGKLADLMITDSHHHGGKLSHSDLANHTNRWTLLISANYRDTQLHEIPPSGQGIAALIASLILDLKEDEIQSAPNHLKTHFEIEAMKLALNEVYAEVADPKHMRKSADDLLDPTFIKKASNSIRSTETLPPKSRPPQQSETVYLATADESGMMVSFIQSNYMGFGSGVVVPGTGISLQNRAAGFVTNPDHPNCVDGGKYPFHTIIPGFITRDKNAFASFGVMGGDMQAQGHLQILRALVRDKNSPQEAINSPRWKLQKDGALLLESTCGIKTASELASLGHNVVSAPYGAYEFGAAQIIARLPDDGYTAGSEPRRDGQAVAT